MPFALLLVLSVCFYSGSAIAAEKPVPVAVVIPGYYSASHKEYLKEIVDSYGLSDSLKPSLKAFLSGPSLMYNDLEIPGLRVRNRSFY